MGKVRINSGGQTEILCPGCKTTHTLNIDPSKKPCWEFNGDFEKPTFSPSILERSGHYCWNDGKDPSECMFCNDPEPEFEDAEFGKYLPCYICHSFVRDGMIEFLSDCTHTLAGQTVPLLDIEDNNLNEGDGNDATLS